MPAIEDLHPFQPFADASKDADLPSAGAEDCSHGRIQHRHSQQAPTIISGMADDYDKKKVVIAFKKKFVCNDTELSIQNTQHPEATQLKGSQFKTTCQFLVEIGLCREVEGSWIFSVCGSQKLL